MQYPDDLGAASGDESDKDDEAHSVEAADGDEADQEVADTGADDDKLNEEGADADDDLEAGSEEVADTGADDDKQNEEGADDDDDLEAGSDSDDGIEVEDIQENAADVRAAATDGDDDDDGDEAADADSDEDVDADPAANRRAKFVVAASLLLAAIVTVAATIYAPPPPVTPSAHPSGLMPITFPTGDVAFSTTHDFPRGGTAIAKDCTKEWNTSNPSSVNFQVGVGLGPGDDRRLGPGDNSRRLKPSAMTRRFLSVVFTSFLHIFYFWHHFGVLDLVLLPLVWVLMGIILYHG